MWVGAAGLGENAEIPGAGSRRHGRGAEQLCGPAARRQVKRAAGLAARKAGCGC